MQMAAQTDWPALRARVDNRLSRYFFKAPLRLRNVQPMVSFTFDDFPESAASVGVPLLDQYNARATFYVTGDLVGK
jgi:peptidoglycan/xylan/chitin deacetylase (PgdA/CDA1 family)